MSYPQYGYQGNHGDQYAQQQQYQSGVPQIQNPFTNDPSAAFGAAIVDPEQAAQLASWNSMYTSNDGDKNKSIGTSIGPRGYKSVVANGEEKQMTVVRKGGGTSWEDNSLLDWDPTHFRLMVGNLAGEVTDDSLHKAFSQYNPSKARVVRDKRTTKSKGFGFVSFPDGELGFKAAREMVGKYIGSHPVTIQRSKTDLRPTQHKDKQQGKKKGRDNRKDDKSGDPLRARTGAGIDKKPAKGAGGLKIIG